MTITNVTFDLESLLELILECGRQQIRVVQRVDEGHSERFGRPESTTVCERTKAGPGILVSGHDMLDSSDLLEQTAGARINVWTHREMLPAHCDPGMKKHSHFSGDYGGPCQIPLWEFPMFSGPILGTKNCMLIPPDTYFDRLFTNRVTAVSGGARRRDSGFSVVIATAGECPPLPEDKVRESTIRFHHRVILSGSDRSITARQHRQRSDPTRV